MNYRKTYRALTEKVRKTDLVSDADLKEYKGLMTFYYSHESPSEELNTNEANYQKVMEAAVASTSNRRITNRFLCDLFNGYDLQRKRSIQTVNDILGFLRNYKQQKTESKKNTPVVTIYNEEEITEVANQLQHHYEQDELVVGAAKANKAYSKFGSHPKILKHVFRFNMRLKEWELIRSIVAKVLEENPSDMVTTQCYLTLFECELREANSNYKADRIEQSRKILYGKRFLNQVPESQHHYNQYLYWNGKWYLELWYSTGGTDISHLTQSLSCFERAIKEKYTWWYHCYKCIILKLLNNKTFKTETKMFTDCMIEEKKRQPQRPAVRTYRIASFVLNDDATGLKIFLAEHSFPFSATDFQSTIFHHIELIYFRDKKKQDLYRKILEDWVAHYGTGKE